MAAPPEKRAAVLDLVADGMAQTAQVRLADAIAEGLRFTGFIVVPLAAARDAIAKNDFPEGCGFGPCVSAVGRALDVGRVLVARIDAEGQTYSYILTLVETAGGTPVAQVTGSCAPCSVDEAIDRIASSIIDLGQKGSQASLKRVTLAPRHERGGAVAAAPWMAAGGVAAVVAGVVLVAQTSQKEAGWATIGAGGALIASSILVFALD